MGAAWNERGNPEIGRTFGALGGLALKKSDFKNAVHNMRVAAGLPDHEAEAGGYPDYSVWLSPLGLFVEGKGPVKGRIAFGEFDRQRKFLDQWPELCYVWLWLGEEPPHRDGGREAYLIDWPAFRAFETQALANGYKSISFDGEYPARTHLAPYSLPWAGNQTWHLPYTHPFWAQRLAAARFFVARCERAFITGDLDHDRLSQPGPVASGRPGGRRPAARARVSPAATFLDLTAP